MPTYLSAWKTFRRLSRENEIIAQHLVEQPEWPKHDGVVVCDLGCGDGRVLESVVIQSPNRVAGAVLLEPDEALLAEAEQGIRESGLVEEIKSVHSSAEEAFPDCAMGCDAIILVHVAYLLSSGDLQKIVLSLPERVPIFIVIDALDSVFSSLWKMTAERFYSRTEKAHDFLRELSGHEGWRVSYSEFMSSIASPLRITRPDLRSAVLSLLCYRSAETLSEAELDWVADVLRSFEVDGNVLCCSSCYVAQRSSL